jgi:Uma2 family endonuclease
MCEDDLAADIDDKVATYLSAGSLALIVVDPARETVVVHDLNGVSLLRAGDMLQHAALPGFALDVGALFARAKR